MKLEAITRGPALNPDKGAPIDTVPGNVGPLTGVVLGAEHPVPAHYDKPVSPWHLQEHMESSGFPFVDARCADVIEYAFRRKGGRQGLIDDLLKARHCLDAAVEHLRKGGAA